MCGAPVVSTEPEGHRCAKGHTEADVVSREILDREVAERRELDETMHTADEDRREVTRADLDDPGFEVREGDRLTVMYHGAKLQIAAYNSVELDGGIYSRTLVPGDDPEEQWDRIYAYLERKALERAREKLRKFSEQLHRARNNVETGTAYDG